MSDGESERCLGTTVSGERCGVRAPLLDESGHCNTHSSKPGAQAERLAIARLGGISAQKRLRKGIDVDAVLGPLEDETDAKRWARQLARCALEGTLKVDQVRVGLQLLREFRAVLEVEALDALEEEE